MKITQSSKIKSLLLAAVLCSGLGFVSPVSAQQVRSYIVDSNGKGLADLGTLGGKFSYAPGINDAPLVVGIFCQPDTNTRNLIPTDGIAMAY
jgi:hypothetical protein